MKKLAMIIALSQPTAALAQDYSEEQKAAFIEAFVANGCTMTEDEASVLLPPTGLDRELSQRISADLMDQGLASGDDATGAFTLSAEICE